MVLQQDIYWDRLEKWKTMEVEESMLWLGTFTLPEFLLFICSDQLSCTPADSRPVAPLFAQCPNQLLRYWQVWKAYLLTLFMNFVFPGLSALADSRPVALHSVELRPTAKILTTTEADFLQTQFPMSSGDVHIFIRLCFRNWGIFATTVSSTPSQLEILPSDSRCASMMSVAA